MEKNYVWSRPWDIQAPVLPIAEQLYYVGNIDVSCHLLKTSAGAILIDTAFASTSYLLTEGMREAGVAPSDLKLILHTHGHVDHCGATRRIQSLSRAPVAFGEADIDAVENGTPLTCAEYMYDIRDFEPFRVDRSLSHGDVVELGGHSITCHHTPGHTAGTMSYTFPLKVGSETLTVGLFGGPGMWTLDDEHRGEQGYEGNRKEFRRSLDYLAGLDVDVWLGAHPGQNRTFEKGRMLGG